MKFENTEVFNFRGSIIGMRNPLESWDKSDSEYEIVKINEGTLEQRGFKLGEKDIKLAQKLIQSGSEHRKFMRQIFVSVEITAPLYWWKEFDTYKTGTTANSTSTMHKLSTTPITFKCFEMSDFTNLEYSNDEYYFTTLRNWKAIINVLEILRLKYLETNDKRYWKELIRQLPESWLQTRTITMNYENILNMIHQRSNHKLTEWSVDFIEWCKSLPYAKELLFIGGDKEC